MARSGISAASTMKTCRSPSKASTATRSEGRPLMFKTESDEDLSFNLNIDDIVAIGNARDLVPKKIFELLAQDERIAYIGSDAAAKGSNARILADEHPDRVIDLGIAEMNI